MSHNDFAMSPTSLPTPAPSTEILPGKKGSLSEITFALPPAAIPGNASDSPNLSTPSPVNSDSSYRPLSPPPSYPAKPSATPKRKYSTSTTQASAATGQNAYTIPPPPTRSRKIIQMKPRGQQVPQEVQAAPMKAPSTPAGPAAAAAAKTSPANAGAKRKQSNGTNTAAGRKIARKTAHSLIERRRRSKMNEEFGVLKDMIPACNGQDMHKLAILQASIEYMKYLEQCLSDLKSAHAHCGSNSHPASIRHPQRLPSLSQLQANQTPRTTLAPSVLRDNSDSASDSDEEMSEAAVASPHSIMRPYSAATSSHPPSHHHPSISPAILPSNQVSPEIMSKNAHRYGSYSAYSSALPSPAFEPMGTAVGPQAFMLTSPALGPMREEGGLEKDDHEATAALLMLNTDRRSWSGPDGGRGMSVKDLLSG